MTHRPFSIFAVLSLAASLLATGLGSATTAAASPALSHTAVGVTVPVVACPTTRGVPGHPPAKYKRQITISEPADIAQKLEYYSDNDRNLTPILAPRGWKCQVQIGADGSASITIHPPGTTTSSKTAITAQSMGACQGCVWGLVCDLIPGAAKQVGADQPACPTTRPKKELVKFERGRPNATGPVQDVVVFQDPAGVKGDGVPSGGKDPANGALLYDWNKHDGGAASLETCTLPAVQFQECAASASNFGAHNWEMP